MIWNQIKTGILRTVVPIITAVLLVALAKANIHIDNTVVEAFVTNVVGVTLGGIYYVAVRVLEHFRDSRWGWLLGSPNAPKYDKASNISVR